MVDDASKFNDFLEENNFQGIIRVGTYQLEEQMSYEEIAIKITN
jgi:cell division protein YceG involved in septum cleavage